MPISNFSPRKARFSSGFTLVELLVVIAIISVLAALSTPAIQSMNRSGGINQAVTGISLSLNEARAYAMAHNTYVWVGFVQPGGTKSLLVGMVAGTTGRAKDILPANPPQYAVITRPQTYNNFAIEKVTSVESSNAALSSPSTGMWTNGTDLIDSAAANPLPGFSMTVNRASVDFPAGQVIQFDPLGQVTSSSSSELPHWVQFGLQPIRGATANDPNVAVIQVAGLTGEVQIFRP